MTTLGRQIANMQYKSQGKMSSFQVPEQVGVYYKDLERGQMHKIQGNRGREQERDISLVVALPVSVKYDPASWLPYIVLTTKVRVFFHCLSPGLMTHSSQGAENSNMHKCKDDETAAVLFFNFSKPLTVRRVLSRTLLTYIYCRTAMIS